MKVKEITVVYTKVKQVKKFEPVTIQQGVTATLEEGESTSAVLSMVHKSLKKSVEAAMDYELDNIYMG